ncbi:TetR-like C-terminal domain-containing protein [Yinghuangia soli]|uniref:TetR/AcrR family transcriptional regulator C-terminal ligand-binding domain-containing protein n=1 Tax=Yinghuangia soli TaxID=2908204 RepID=A0AA41Q585_9ACTN|nr:TetR-like C-terminal domain-containing protein [Yinghuangia soli]MCF2531521.1 TetR/AcrR family transcriptional regulator C-terminal ligand-binding domain-containing protein [Yinghuangia soli]
MPRPGRPAGPAPDTSTVVLTAALELLLTEGAAALTPQRLHTATGVSRTTIYRHWPTPHALLCDLIEVAPARTHVPSGDVRRDLHSEVDLLCDRLRDKPVGGFLQALVAAASVDPDTAELRRRYVEDLLAPFHAALAHTAPDEAARTDAAMSIAAPLLVDALLLGRPAHRDRAHRTVDEVLERVPRT